MPDQADIIRFLCQCGAKLKAPSVAIGRRIRCPKCKRAFLVADPDAPAQVVEPQPPRPRPRRPSAPSRSPVRPSAKSPKRTASNESADPSEIPTPIPGDDLALAVDSARDSSAKKKGDPAPAGDDWLNDLAASETSAETTSKPRVVSPQSLDLCANCQKALPVGAMKCPLCGHAKVDPKAKKAKKKKARSPDDGSIGKVATKTGRFFVGCALSFVGALIGAGIWAGIAALTESEFGLMAIGLGALCGYGMAIGYGDQSFTAGMAAAGISLMGVVGAKLLILVYILYGALTGNTSNFDLQKVYVVGTMTDEACDKTNCSDDEWDTLYDQMEERVDGMGKTEVVAKWQAYKDKEVDPELEAARRRLASFRAGRRGDRDGLALYD